MKKKINKSKLLICGVFFYLIFYVLIFSIGHFTKLYTVKAEEYNLKYSETGKINKDNNGNVFVSFYVNGDSFNQFKKGQVLSVKIEGNVVDSKVYKINKNKDKSLIELKITDQNELKCSNYNGKFDIMYDNVDCFKIPKSSVVTKQNNKGVFVLNEGYRHSKFMPIKYIIYNDKKFVYLDYNKINQKGFESVGLNDRIILRPNYFNTNIRIK